MHRVMIGTPCYDARNDIRYTHSLTQTVRMGMQRGIEVRELFPVALIQDARNECIQCAVDAGFDDLVFIDSDQDWEAADFFRLLAHPVDCVGVPIRRKDDTDKWNVKVRGGLESILMDPATGLLTAPDMAVGCGMLRLSRRALKALWDGAANLEYTVYGNRPRARWIFHLGPLNGELMSEDIYACEQLRKYGIPTWIDPTIKIGHTGPKRYTGDFTDSLARLHAAALVPVSGAA